MCVERWEGELCSKGAVRRDKGKKEEQVEKRKRQGCHQNSIKLKAPCEESPCGLGRSVHRPVLHKMNRALAALLMPDGPPA